MEKKYFQLPDELPAGFFEAVKPIADWAKKAMQEVYQSGYYAGKADSSREWSEICDRIRKDDRRKKPPTGAAPALSLS
jgi:hypothetical protein